MDNSFLYIDPGSMSAFTAMIIGALAGAAMYIKIKLTLRLIVRLYFKMLLKSSQQSLNHK